MKQFFIAAFLFMVTIQALTGQQQFSESPINAQFITTDYNNFWKAFDTMDSISENPFIEYLDNASEGLKPFVGYLNADSLYQTVLRRKEDYLRSRPMIAEIDTKKKKVQAAYAAMKYWYPEARFPPVYFVVGMFTSGGTASENGLVIGSEMLNNLDGLNGLISHELIHYQQKISGDDNLLKQAIIEGSADFIGELISGEHINRVPFNYGNENESSLCKEFVSKMLKDDYTDWLYGTSGKDKRPNDLGYWIGYKITEAYFNRQQDKIKAIANILNINNPLNFTKESGYLAKYWK
ncbi:MAG: DUF2268 domain-containing putative Zn-dependent protease [Flavobacteriaceae bacterium]|nr:DUF2268 domain-containing putative Zn-dependent protease [Flavobacteriaceae bacterium]